MATTKVIEDGNGKGLNWAVILNVALLAIVIIGAWFTTFSSPLSEKFVALDKVMSTANQQHDKDIEALRRELRERIDATDKAHALVTKELEASIDRRFAAQAKADDEIKDTVNKMQAEIEQRRIEVATKSDLTSLLQTTRLEFLAEIKRLDQVAAQALSKDTFDIWRGQRTVMTNQMQQQLDSVQHEVFSHEKADRDADQMKRSSFQGSPK